MLHPPILADGSGEAYPKMLFRITAEQETQRGRRNQLENIRGFRDCFRPACRALPFELYAGEYGDHYEAERDYGQNCHILEVLNPPIMLLLRIDALSARINRLRVGFEPATPCYFEGLIRWFPRTSLGAFSLQ
ncbi:hypothetical protein [Bifidobacterium sp. SO4]|uniref:hypothetical protein n=1 Tax=Bifidobacterium sp. SO4 TaxID=2809030 RepID=UPI001BDD661F|nr:hypothetical protein [Bifidobacterium sp. SO4]MBT1170190.1 hypothetical protein [Bifidobacterium sp. SO4]